MQSSLPEYIEIRIRKRPPDSLPIVPGSTPVVAFGDVRNATVATLGWNPSKLEFLDRDGNELTGQHRRLETLSSLNQADLSLAPIEAVNAVFNGCNHYFQQRPYRRWFDRLEKILSPLGKSYYNVTACHLDFVQWATDPVWRDLERPVKEHLLEADLAFLRQQIIQERIELLLLNGSGIAKTCVKLLGVELTESASPAGGRLFDGHTPQGVRVIGWSQNLQSSFGVSNEYIGSVAATIRTLLSGS
jgi:hypothetical protein